MTMGTKHSPAPWEQGHKTEYGTFNANIIFSGENGVCAVFDIPVNTELENVDSDRYAQGLADARLIKAAPELLELLKDWIENGRFLSGNSEEKKLLVEKSKSIIKSVEL